MKLQALLLHASGTNRDLDLAEAFRAVGVEPCIHTLNELRTRHIDWHAFQILALAGGFSYADALGAGKIYALELQHYFQDEIESFIASRKPVIGICNGFQILAKAGVLPGKIKTSLTFNQSGHFDCRWVHLQSSNSHCLWTRGLTELVYCPVAHGEGRFIVSPNCSLPAAAIALRYCDASGTQAAGQYPLNPNGSIDDIAGVCNSDGNVLGLMPHPENHIYHHQHPRWMRGERGMSGLSLFQNAVNYLLHD